MSDASRNCRRVGGDIVGSEIDFIVLVWGCSVIEMFKKDCENFKGLFEHV